MTDTQSAGAAQLLATIRAEAIEPAEEKARQLVADAEKEADQILTDAREKIANEQREWEQQKEKDRARLTAERDQAVRRVLTTVEAKLTDLCRTRLTAVVQQQMSEEDVLANLVQALVARKLEGESLTVIVSDEETREILQRLLAEPFANRLSVTVDPRFTGMIVIESSSGTVNCTISNEELTQIVQELIAMPQITER